MGFRSAMCLSKSVYHQEARIASHESHDNDLVRSCFPEILELPIMVSTAPFLGFSSFMMSLTYGKASKAR